MAPVPRPDISHPQPARTVARSKRYSVILGQRAPEEPAYYEKIANAVALGGKIVVVGHGAGKSNAAGHLTEYLQAHHRQKCITARPINGSFVKSSPAVLRNAPQLLDLARQALGS